MDEMNFNASSTEDILLDIVVDESLLGKQLYEEASDIKDRIKILAEDFVKYENDMAEGLSAFSESTRKETLAAFLEKLTPLKEKIVIRLAADYANDIFDLYDAIRKPIEAVEGIITRTSLASEMAGRATKVGVDVYGLIKLRSIDQYYEMRFCRVANENGIDINSTQAEEMLRDSDRNIATNAFTNLAFDAKKYFRDIKSIFRAMGVIWASHEVARESNRYPEGIRGAVYDIFKDSSEKGILRTVAEAPGKIILLSHIVRDSNKRSIEVGGWLTNQLAGKNISDIANNKISHIQDMLEAQFPRNPEIYERLGTLQGFSERPVFNSIFKTWRDDTLRTLASQQIKRKTFDQEANNQGWSAGVEAGLRVGGWIAQDAVVSSVNSFLCKNRKRSQLIRRVIAGISPHFYLAFHDPYPYEIPDQMLKSGENIQLPVSGMRSQTDERLFSGRLKAWRQSGNQLGEALSTPSLRS